jgi:hypothetical protein
MGPFFRRTTTGERASRPKSRRFARFSLGHDGRVVVCSLRDYLQWKSEQPLRVRLDAPIIGRLAAQLIERGRECQRLLGAA